MIYDSKITETVNINTAETATFTPQANINVKDVGIEVSASGATLDLNNNITVTNSATSGTVEVNGVYSSSDVYVLYLYNETAKKTIKATGKITSGNLDVYGIHLENPYLYMTGEELLYNFNTSAVVDTDGDIEAVGFSASKLSSYVAFKGNYTVSSKIGQGMALSYGISLGEAFIRNVSGKFKVSAEAKAGDAVAMGVFVKSQELYSSNIASRLTGSFTVSAKGDRVSAAAVYAASDLSLISVSGAMNVTAKGTQVASAAAIISDSDIYLYGINSSKISVNSSGVTGSGMYQSIAAAILSEKDDGKIVIGSYSGAISVKASSKNGFNNVYGMVATDNITFTGNYTGNLTVSNESGVEDAQTAGLVVSAYTAGSKIHLGSISMQDITGKWNISAKGDAMGIFAPGDITADNISGNITVSSKSGTAAAVYNGIDAREADPGSVEGIKYEFPAFEVDSISGKITVTAEKEACGIYSSHFIPGDLSKMNMSVTSRTNTAIGLSLLGLKIKSSGLNLGKINVSAALDATGVFAEKISVSGTPSDQTRITGTITVKSKNDIATGFVLSGENFIISTNITVTGFTGACGVTHHLSEDDFYFYGAKITAKTTGKGGVAYSARTNGGNAYIRGKSQLTGHIQGDEEDVETVVIESGSKINGGMEEVDKILFEINDASTKKKVMWNASADLGISELDYDIEFGLSGDFALAQKTSKMQWSDLISNLGDTLNSKYDNELFDYTVYEKGNTLYLKSEVKKRNEDYIKVIDEKSAKDHYFSGCSYVMFTSKADVNVKEHFCAIDGTAGLDDITFVLDNNITLTSSNESCHGIGLKNERTATIYSNNAAKKLKVTNKNKFYGAASYALGYSMAGDMTFGGSKFMQSISVSISSSYTNYAYGIKNQGKITFEGDFTGKLTVTATGNNNSFACGIYNYKDLNGCDINIKRLSGAWNISSTGWALAIHSAAALTIGEVASKITVTGKAQKAYAFESTDFTADTISSAITVSGAKQSYGIHASGNITLGDASRMNLKVTAKEGNVSYTTCGICSEKNLIVQDNGLNLGKITVSNTGSAHGVSVWEKIYTAGVSGDDPILTGNITVKSKNATGILCDQFCSDVPGGTGYVKVGATINATGTTDARGIEFQFGNLDLEGAKITAKVSDKYSFAYTVYEKDEKGDYDSAGNIIALRKKSQVTGNIRMDGSNDTVIIESGSKLTGAISDVEKLIFELNNQAAKKSLWEITADLSLSAKTALEIDFELGMTGDFVLANNKSGATWDDMFANAIALDFNGYIQNLSLSDVTTYGCDSLTYNDYDFTLKTKGSQLILSVKGN